MFKIVGVPIGNLEDISIRQLKELFSADVVIAEDTRNFIKLRNLLSGRFSELLKSMELGENRPELISYRDQIHDRVFDRILNEIQSGKDCILISDAGMPLISDPGFKLISSLIENEVGIDVIPGATSIETALVLSGLPSDRFSFIGFLPRERSKILKLITKFKDTESTIIFFESPYRIKRTLEILSSEYPNLLVSLSNDLTKKFQKTIRGNVFEVLELIKNGKVQGEWVVCLRFMET